MGSVMSNEPYKTNTIKSKILEIEHNSISYSMGEFYIQSLKKGYSATTQNKTFWWKGIQGNQLYFCDIKKKRYIFLPKNGTLHDAFSFCVSPLGVCEEISIFH